MSRSGYSEDGDDNWQMIRWQGAVKSAIRGKNGQVFLRTLITALDALPEKRLIAEELEANGEFCALGSVGKLRSIDMHAIDPEDYDQISEAFQIPPSLAREIMYVNDEWLPYKATPEQRFDTVRKWAVEHLATTEQEISG